MVSILDDIAEAVAGVPEKYRDGEIELELVPQGNLAEGIRAASTGIGAFYTPTGYGTPLAEGKEVRETTNGRHYVLEYPVRADYALVKAHRADQLGNLVYRKTARNFGPVMAAAATTTVVQVEDVVPVGALDPEVIVIPCIFVDRIIAVPAPAQDRIRNHLEGQLVRRPGVHDRGQRHPGSAICTW